MIKLSIDEVRKGDQLGQSLFYENGTKMLNFGTTLQPDTIARLKRQDVSPLLVFTEETEDVEASTLIGEDLRNDLRQMLRDVYLSIRRRANRELEVKDYTEAEEPGMEHVRKGLRDFKEHLGKKLLPDTLDDLIDQLISDLPSYRGICSCPGFPKRTALWLFDHSIDVTVWSLLLGKRAGFRTEDLENIALGTLFHDMGYALYEEDQIRNMGGLGKEERIQLRNHALIGYILLRIQSKGNLLSAHVAYQHHERQDGKGYPRGITGNNRLVTKKQEALRQDANVIHRYADVVTVANDYDRMISGFPGQSRLPSDRCIHRLKKGGGTRYNEEAVNVFLKLVPPYPVAQPVVARKGKYKGYRGVVIKVYPEKPHRPVVRFLYTPEGPLDSSIDVDLREEKVKIQASNRLRTVK